MLFNASKLVGLLGKNHQSLRFYKNIFKKNQNSISYIIFPIPNQVIHLYIGSVLFHIVYIIVYEVSASHANYCSKTVGKEHLQRELVSIYTFPFKL